MSRFGPAGRPVRKTSVLPRMPSISAVHAYSSAIPLSAEEICEDSALTGAHVNTGSALKGSKYIPEISRIHTASIYTVLFLFRRIRFFPSLPHLSPIWVCGKSILTGIRQRKPLIS